MKRLLFLLPAALLAIAYQDGSFPLLMGSLTTFFIATAFNLISFRSGLMVLASVSASWTLAEAALSMLDETQSDIVSFHDPHSGAPLLIWRVHERYGALPRPGQYNAIKHTDGGDLVYDVLYTIGDDGFRSTPQPRQSSGRQAFFLGASETFGEGLNDDQTLPYDWAELNPDYHVTNLAVSGWGPHQALSVWADVITDRGAVVFLGTVPWHAERSACIPRFSGLSPKFGLVDGKLVREGKCRVFVGGAFIGRVLMESAVIQRIYDLVYRENPDDSIELYVALIKQMQRLADDRGQCLIVAFSQADKSYLARTKYSNADIIERLRGEGIKVVDVTLAATREDLDPKYYIANDGHPSDMANRMKARLLSEFKRECGLKAAD